MLVDEEIVPTSGWFVDDYYCSVVSHQITSCRAWKTRLVGCARYAQHAAAQHAAMRAAQQAMAQVPAGEITVVPTVGIPTGMIRDIHTTNTAVYGCLW